MNTFGRSILASIILVLGFTTSTIAADITITNASTTFPKRATVYRKETDVSLNYLSIDSADGIKQIYAKTIDFNASGKPRKTNVLRKHKLLQRPTMMGNKSIGYVEHPHASQNKIAYLPLINCDGCHVKPQQKTFQATVAGADRDNIQATHQMLANERGRDTRPIIRGAYTHSDSMVTGINYITKPNNMMKLVET